MINQNPNRNMPFLHRNWLSGLASWQPKPKTSPDVAAKPAHKPDGDQLDDRPAKRPRFNDHASVTEQKPSLDFDRYQLPEFPRSFPKVLRIDVLKLVHKDALRTRFNTTVSIGDLSRSKARCKITISHTRINIFQEAKQVVLHCESRLCEIITFTHSQGPSSHPTARITLPQPFVIPQEQILVLREDSNDYDFAEDYTITMELESAGGDIWPPLQLTSPLTDEDIFRRKAAPLREWVLSASLHGLMGRSSCKMPLRLRRHPDRSDIETEYRVEFDTAWTTSTTKSPSDIKNLDQDISPSIVALGGRVDGLSALYSSQAAARVQERHTAALGHMGSPVNGVSNGHALNGFTGAKTNGSINSTINGVVNRVAHEEDELAEGELTPSRSLRARANNMVYNLKKLSDKAHGTERTYRRRQHQETWNRPGVDGETEDCSVTYNLPAEQLAVEGFVCCVCLVTTPTMSQLRAHFLNHPYYTFEYHQRVGQVNNLVQIKRVSEAPAPPLRPGVYQLGRATRPFDLDRYLSGDNSWISSRLGPLNNVEVELPVVQVPPKLTHKRRAAKPVVVPNIKHPLFDAVSKVLLVPGSEYRSTPTDYSWQVQKHREVIQDYSDLAAPEKEFIQEWDAFLIGKLVSSDAHVAQYYVAFALAKASWLLAKPSRQVELAKHMSMLVLKKVLDDETIRQVMSIIDAARLKQGSPGQAPLPVESTRTSPKEAAYKSKKGCGICARPVLGSNLVICSNKDCKTRVYHKRCLQRSESAGSKSQRKEFGGDSWVCTACSPKVGEQRSSKA